jgi:hypothetical protein
LGEVSVNAALLLRGGLDGAIDLVRYQPDGQNGSNPTLSWYAWDQTQGSAGDRFNISAVGGTSAFSATTDTFTVNIQSLNDPPTLTKPIADQNATEDQPFSFTVPDNTFADVDAGDTITLSSSSGTGLPDWLRFDAATRTFSGTPTNADVGTVDVTLFAHDVQGDLASDTFTITVANVNDAPSGIPDTGTGSGLVLLQGREW